MKSIGEASQIKIKGAKLTSVNGSTKSKGLMWMTSLQQQMTTPNKISYICPEPCSIKSTLYSHNLAITKHNGGDPFSEKKLKNRMDI